MPQPKKKPENELGYINVRISKKAHRALLRRSLDERRTLIATLDVLLGV